jgi:hypothetical protein
MLRLDVYQTYAQESNLTSSPANQTNPTSNGAGSSTSATSEHMLQLSLDPISSASPGQSLTISGSLTDPTNENKGVAGEPITVSHSDGSVETTTGTDLDGRFSVTAKVPNTVGNTWNVAARFNGDPNKYYAGGSEATLTAPVVTNNPPVVYPHIVNNGTPNTNPGVVNNGTPENNPVGKIFNNPLPLLPNNPITNNPIVKTVVPNDKIPWSMIGIVVIIIAVIVGLARAFSKKTKPAPASSSTCPSPRMGGAPELASRSPISQARISHTEVPISHTIATGPQEIRMKPSTYPAHGHSKGSLLLNPHIANSIGDVKILTTSGIEHPSSINSPIFPVDPGINNIHGDVVVRIEAGIGK